MKQQQPEQLRHPQPPQPSPTEARTLQARNSATVWKTIGRARGHEVTVRPGFVAVEGGERAGLRVLIQEPSLTREDRSALEDLVRAAKGPVNAEDPFGATDLAGLDLRSWQMPVMLRNPAPAPEPALEVVRAETPEDLEAAERVVIAGFELDGFLPYRAGELFPGRLLEEPGLEIHLARYEGAPAGACLSLAADGIASHYWVGTSPNFRSRGVGRAVMAGSLTHLTHLPLTLTASKLGRPLYESLGYETASLATWWGPRLT
ncbi:GNAT family N-acetyltransferase [Streptomyces sp. NPDC048659]|uniref:GNAT family N-acetyltransferase n=1 Tax=Streptomyces sp. NPDC048659 TaxID=3155489 RepID=UPI00342C9C12